MSQIMSLPTLNLSGTFPLHLESNLSCLVYQLRLLLPTSPTTTPPPPPCARQRGTRSGRTGFLSPANTAKPATPGSFTFCPLRLEFSSPLSLHGPPFLLSLDLGLAGVYSGHGIYSGSPSLSTVTKDDLHYYHTSLIPL